MKITFHNPVYHIPSSQDTLSLKFELLIKRNDGGFVRLYPVDGSKVLRKLADNAASTVTQFTPNDINVTTSGNKQIWTDSAGTSGPTVLLPVVVSLPLINVPYLDWSSVYLHGYVLDELTNTWIELFSFKVKPAYGSPTSRTIRWLDTNWITCFNLAHL